MLSQVLETLTVDVTRVEGLIPACQGSDSESQLPSTICPPLMLYLFNHSSVVCRVRYDWIFNSLYICMIDPLHQS